jgi:hypothetical protein
VLMISIRTRIVTLLPVAAGLTVGLLAQAPPEPGTFVVGRNQIAVVDFGGQRLAILPETQNYLGDAPNFPSRWEFSIDPVLMPEFDQGKLKLTVYKNFKNSSKICCGGGATDYTVVTRVGIPLLLMTDDVREQAAKRVTAKFPDLKYTFTADQFVVIPVSSLSVEFPDLASTPCALQDSSIPITSSQPRVYVWIDCTDTVRNHVPKDVELKSFQHLTDTLAVQNLKSSLITM